MMTVEEVRKHIENRIQDLEKQIDGPEDFYYGIKERIRELRDLLTDLFSEKNMMTTEEKIRLEKQFCCDGTGSDGRSQQIHMWHLESLFQECFGQHLFFESGIWKQ